MRNLKLQRSRIYATSAFCSVVEEGMTNSSPEVDGGAGSSAAGGGATDVAEAAEGEIIATSAGANFFAFSKKAFISSRVRPWGELTFSQSKSAPCAKDSAIAPSTPRLRESPFSWRVGSSVVSKALARFFKLSFGTAAFFFGHNPMNSRDKTQLTNSKVSWIDIQFASSRLTAVSRGSSPGCKDDEDTPINPAQQKRTKEKRKEKYQQV
jgi:hypothetical protein